VLPLHDVSQVQLDPAHCREPLHAGPDGQHVWFAAPHAQVPLRHCNPAPQVVPLQQDSPALPHAQVPLEQVRFVLQNVPLQQWTPWVPQGWQDPLTQS
jgi:hypothetical protein